jgi:symplekin
MIPPNHTVLNVHALEAEATGLLDRMLGVLQDNNRYESQRIGCADDTVTNWMPSVLHSDVLTVDATLNTLSILVRMRPSTSNRVLNAILNFNPLRLATTSMTPKTKVIVRSMEKTTKMLLTHLARR